MGGDLGDGFVADPLVLVYRDWLLTWVTGLRPGEKCGSLVDSVVAELLILVYRDWLLT